MKRKGRKPPIHKTSPDYRTLYYAIDGAVHDAFRQHPEYLSGSHGEDTVRASITKRVTGTLKSLGISPSGPSRRVRRET